jgi:hypothetical protein
MSPAVVTPPLSADGSTEAPVEGEAALGDEPSEAPADGVDDAVALERGTELGLWLVALPQAELTRETRSIAMAATAVDRRRLGSSM